MTKNGTAAYGMYSRDVALPDVVCALSRAGFDKADICMVLSPAHPDAAIVFDDSQVDNSRGKESTSERMIRWFSEFGAVFIPTVGFFIRSEAFSRALGAEHTGVLSRGGHTLLGLGFPRDEAQRLGQLLSDVGALVYVSCSESNKARGIMELLRRLGAREAATLSASKSTPMAA